MQTPTKILTALAVILAGAASAQPTAFTYQGKLVDDCCPATGLYDLRFQLYDGATSPNTIGPLTITNAVPVTNGLFTALVTTGAGAWDAAPRWLEIRVATNGSATFVTLNPRQLITPTPEAIYAQRAGSVTNNAITAAHIASGQVVKSLNGLKDAINLVAGANVTLTPSGNNLQVSATGGGLSLPYRGAGTASPIFALTNTAAGVSIWGESIGGGGRGVFGKGDYGVWGESASGYGVLGQSTAVNGSGVAGVGDYGVSGRSDSAGGRGVAGTATSSAPDSVGVKGYHSPTGNYGELGNGSYGVYGYGGTGWALFTEGDNGSPLPSLRPKAYLAGGSAVGNRAARFEGAVDIVGATEVQGYVQLTGQDRSVIFYSPANYDFRLIGEGSGATRSLTILDVTAGARQDLLKLTPTGVQTAGTLTTCVLTITGGCDLAEPFDVSEADIPKGAVVVIDEENPGHLKMSDRAYDNRVAGIVSGAKGVNPGIMLKQEGTLEGTQNVALTGRVYALADASESSIKPGDLLTTSATPGHAMKASDSAKSHGAILGKAMTGLKEGKGHVLVLVNLQ